MNTPGIDVAFLSQSLPFLRNSDSLDSTVNPILVYAEIASKAFVSFDATSRMGVMIYE